MATGSRIYQWGTFNSFAALTAGTTPLDGDVANVIMGGQSTKWYYDATLAVWRINGLFVTTSATFSTNVALAGMLNGDTAIATDNGEKAYWNGVGNIYVINT